MKGFIRNQMDGMAEESYAVFQKKLVFTSLPVEGIRIPRLRALVSAAGEDERRAFMDGCEFSSYEEVLVYGFCAGKIREKEKLKKEIDFLLPHFDNWAHVDCVTASLSAIKRDRDFFLGAYSGLAGAEGEFYKRFLAVMLMDFYLDEKYVSVPPAVCGKCSCKCSDYAAYHYRRHWFSYMGRCVHEHVSFPALSTAKQDRSRDDGSAYFIAEPFLFLLEF